MQIIANENLISYCGFYCVAYPKSLKEESINDKIWTVYNPDKSEKRD